MRYKFIIIQTAIIINVDKVHTYIPISAFINFDIQYIIIIYLHNTP